MSMQILLKEDVSAWVEHLIKWYAVVAPVEKNGRTVFRRISSPDEVNLSYSTSVLPPKKALLPTRELLIEFQGGPGEACVEPILNDTPTVLLGVHTCDIHAIYLLDRVFSGAVSDEHYMERRKNIIFAGVECLEPCSEKCFCKSMETLAVPEHFDLHMTDIGHA
jgi:sulfhydrogenase subunit beta (sulfur reductase)